MSMFRQCVSADNKVACLLHSIDSAANGVTDSLENPAFTEFEPEILARHGVPAAFLWRITS